MINKSLKNDKITYILLQTFLIFILKQSKKTGFGIYLFLIKPLVTYGYLYLQKTGNLGIKTIRENVEEITQVVGDSANHSIERTTETLNDGIEIIRDNVEEITQVLGQNANASLARTTETLNGIVRITDIFVENMPDFRKN